jgi:hypothetical protein
VDTEDYIAHTQLDEDFLRDLKRENDITVTLSQATEILALQSETTDPDQLLTEARHELMLLMSNAIANVDVVAGDIDMDLSPNEIQAKLEGRLPMTLYEFAVFNQYFTDRSTRQ